MKNENFSEDYRLIADLARKLVVEGKVRSLASKVRERLQPRKIARSQIQT